MVQNGLNGFKRLKTVFKLFLRKLDFVSSYAPMHKYCACYFLISCLLRYFSDTQYILLWERLCRKHPDFFTAILIFGYHN